MKLKTRLTLIKDHPGFRKYFANTSWLMGERILRMAVSLFVGILVARYLGPERYGLLSYANSFVGIFIVLGTMGLDDIIVRELVKTPEQQEKILGSSFLLKLVGTLLMWMAILAAVPFTKNDFQTNILIIIIAFGAVFQAFNVIDFNFQAKVKSKFIVHAQFVQLIISSIVKIILVVNETPLIWFASVYCLDAIVLAMGLIFVYFYNGNNIFHWKWSFETSKYLLRDSWPLMFAGVVVSVYMKIDQVMIKEMLGAKEVGLYAAAVKLCEAWYFVPSVITASLFPAILSTKQKSKPLYQDRLQKLYDLMVWGSVAVALPTTLVADWLILIIYGNEFKDAADVLRIYIWAGVFVALGVASSKWLVAENLEKYSFYRTVLGAILNVGCNLWLIPIFGIKGAVFATLISYFTVAYVSLGFFKKTRGNFWTATCSLNPYAAFRRVFQ